MNMKQRLLAIFLFGLLIQLGVAQTPKWMDKAKRTVFSIITYDESDKILNTGNGFFISEEGVALADYALFKGAYRAVVITSDGVSMPVEIIMGANDIYDVVKFRVRITGKKVSALNVAKVAQPVDTDVYLLPYSTQKDRSFLVGKVKESTPVEGKYEYYMLEMKLKEKMVSCPIVNAQGEVLGLAQRASGKDTATVCYAISAGYAMSLEISPFSFNDIALQNIKIRKALPGTEDQALVSLYMASSQLSPEKYVDYLDNFIEQYPDNSEGYLRRASNRLISSKDADSLEKSEEDMNKALAVSRKQDEVYFTRSKLIYGYCLEKPEQPYKDWSYDKALDEVRKAISIVEQPVYVQLEGDILFAKQDYASALVAYEKVNSSNLASPATFFSSAKTKQMMNADAGEVLLSMDSCIARCIKPYTADAAPYLLERALMRSNAGQGRAALQDYDAYYDAVKGDVNDLFYYYREQAALKARQYQRALDDLHKAIELNPQELTYRSELAVVNLRVGRYEESVKVLQETLKLDPSYAEAYRLLGIAQLQLKRNKEACISFVKAQELGDPNAGALLEKHCK